MLLLSQLLTFSMELYMGSALLPGTNFEALSFVDTSGGRNEAGRLLH